MAEAVPAYRDAMGTQVGELLGLPTPRVRRYPASAFLRCALVIDYWTDPDILEVLIRYERALILEVAQHLGNLGQVSEWVARYQEVLERLRHAGFRGPIALDAPSGGNDVDSFLSGAPDVLAADPLGNTLFSVEGWFGSVAEISSRLEAFSGAGIPYFMGEFSGYAGGDCPDTLGDVGPLLAKMQELGVGWFGWSWGGVQNSFCAELDITEEGSIDAFTAAGEPLARSDPNSIARTSVRLESLTADVCPE